MPEEWGIFRVGQFLQKADGEIDALLFGGGEGVPPLAEFIAEFDIPRHDWIMS